MAVSPLTLGHPENPSTTCNARGGKVCKDAVDRLVGLAVYRGRFPRGFRAGRFNAAPGRRGCDNSRRQAAAGRGVRPPGTRDRAAPPPQWPAGKRTSGHPTRGAGHPPARQVAPRASAVNNPRRLAVNRHAGNRREKAPPEPGKVSLPNILSLSRRRGRAQGGPPRQAQLLQGDLRARVS
jgi:hypothetical protein